MSAMEVFADIQFMTGVSEDFLYALVTNQPLPAIKPLNAEQQAHADKLIIEGWTLEDAIDYASGRFPAVELYSLYKRDPLNFYRNLHYTQSFN